jgi:ABC-type glutathione transport system ATPase component
MNDAPLLSLEQVGIQYRSGGFGGVGQTVHRVLDEVSLDLRPGEVLSLLGQSGSGKTSLARAIMGLVPLQSGRISYGGRVIRVAGAAYRNRVPIYGVRSSWFPRERETVCRRGFRSAGP